MASLASRFVVSAASSADFPATDLPEVAMVGRSNVGKSSLINALVKSKIARTSAAPGKTRLANYYQIESRGASPESRRPFYLVDLPGYGYARGGAVSADAFETLTHEYFNPKNRARPRLAGVLHLIDSRHPALDSDAAAHRWLLQTGAVIAVVATKIDKLPRAELNRAISALRETYDTSVLPVSANAGTGLDDVWKMIRSWM